MIRSRPRSIGRVGAALLAMAVIVGCGTSADKIGEPDTAERGTTADSTRTEVAKPVDTTAQVEDLTTSTAVATTSAATASAATTIVETTAPATTQAAPTVPFTIPTIPPTTAPPTIATLPPTIPTIPALVPVATPSAQTGDCPVSGHLHETVAGCGDAGPLVFQVQNDLVCVGYSLAIDGVFGPDTYRSVVNFQVQHYLTADGLAGPSTQYELAGACEGSFGD